jgi:hypothetical protein
MDPAIVLDQPVQGDNNWLVELHRRFVALIPQAPLWQIYESPTGPIEDHDYYQVLSSLFQGVVVDNNDCSIFLSQLLIPYRS